MKHSRAFTLVELPIVLGVVIVSGAVLCAAMTSARAGARTASAAQNMRMSTIAIFQMTDDLGHFPPSYVWGSDPESVEWTFPEQGSGAPGPNGIVHWSGMALAGGYIADESIFTSPDAPRGGAPKANPGPELADWEAGQVNQLGSAAPAAWPNDRQARRLAFTVNHAIMARNKLSSTGMPRWNRLVGSEEIEFGARPQRGKSGVAGAGSGQGGGAVSGVDGSSIAAPARTILMAEWAFTPSLAWRTIAVNNGSGDEYKSYRPVTPFVGVSAGTNVYAEPNSVAFARFRYPTVGEIQPLGPDMLATSTELNAVGRHRAGGTSLFAHLDGAVVQMTVQQTIAGRLWGERFHSITGNTAVVP